MIGDNVYQMPDLPFTNQRYSPQPVGEYSQSMEWLQQSYGAYVISSQ
jgi:hypothetical protein